jgi:hypothetical protein
MDPLINPPNIIVDDIGDMTLEPFVGLHTFTNTSVPQVTDLNPSSHKATRLEKSIEGDSDSNHAPINQYLRYPKPLMPEVNVGSRFVIVATSNNYFRSPIKD